MATVGQQLLFPEAGWRRYDDTDSRIVYASESQTDLNGVYYKGSVRYKDANDLFASFRFKGSKLRIIAPIGSVQTDNAVVTIDDVNYTYNAYGTSDNQYQQVLVYEITGLEYKNHVVTLTNSSQDGLARRHVIAIDAIDIDVTGYLLLPISVNLTATEGNTQVTLRWDAVVGATGYNVKRATTAGGPYTTIVSNVNSTSYVDIDVVNGTTYYYIVTAITADEESDISNEASATPVEEAEAVLRVTMIDSSEREYQLITTEIDGFINWINNHTSGDPASYLLNKNVGLYSSKEYLLFDKIISFEVTELK